MTKLDSLSPTETLELASGLSLVPRIKLLLTIHRSDDSVKLLDEWLLKRSLIDFCKSSLSVTVPEDDLDITRFKDLKKRKREDPVARGTLFIRDLGFLTLSKFDDGESDKVKVLEKKLFDWRKNVVQKMDGIELSIVGVKFKLSVEVPNSDDFNGMKKEWEELAAFGSRGYARGGRRQPDTIVLRGVPTRWFVEPLVPERPSQIVTHTIFSALGEIKTLDVDVDNDTCKLEDEDDGYVVPGLQCKIIIQYKEHREFCNALKVLSGRSLQKQGSRLKADYEVTWNNDGFYRNARSQPEETGRLVPSNRYNSEARHESYSSRFSSNRYNSEARHESYSSLFSSDDGRPKRFKE